jgi:hypothetical protein
MAWAKLGIYDQSRKKSSPPVNDVYTDMEEIEMSDSQGERDEKSYLALLKHPLVLLLIGSVLSYLLVPWIGEKLSHKHVLQEGRVNQARDVLKQVLVDDEQLNRIETAYGMFDNGAASDPKGYKAAQAELRRTSRELYLEFDGHAWWWRHDLPMLSELLGLPTESKKTIENLNLAYEANLKESCLQLALLGRQFLGDDYVPRNPKNAEVLNAVKDRMTDLGKERSYITSRLVSLFMPSKLNW